MGVATEGVGMNDLTRRQRELLRWIVDEGDATPEENPWAKVESVRYAGFARETLGAVERAGYLQDRSSSAVMGAVELSHHGREVLGLCGCREVATGG